MSRGGSYRPPSSTGSRSVGIAGSSSWDLEDPGAALHFDLTITPQRLTVCLHPDGSMVKLGEGGFGTVSSAIYPADGGRGGHEGFVEHAERSAWPSAWSLLSMPINIVKKRCC